MKKTIMFLSLVMILSVHPAAAQYSSTKDAQYLATIKAVADYKINDEEELRNVEKLRADVNFNKKLQRMLNKLQNTRSKNSDNERVLKILKDAGKQIYDILK